MLTELPRAPETYNVGILGDERPRQRTHISEHLPHPLSYKLSWSMPWISFVWVHDSRIEMVTGGMFLCKCYCYQFLFFLTSEQTCVSEIVPYDELPQGRLWLGASWQNIPLSRNEWVYLMGLWAFLPSLRLHQESLAKNGWVPYGARWC